MRLNNNHISYTSCHDIAEIIKPFRQFGISFFVYVKIFPDGSRISLNNDVLWSKFFFENFSKYTNGEIFEITEEEKPTLLKELWTLKKENNLMLIDNEREFNLGNGIDIILPGKEYTEFFVFGADKNKTEMNSFYLNHFDLLTQAMFYFKEKGKQIIKKAERDGLIYLPYDRNTEAQPSINKEKIMKEIQPSRYYLNGQYQDIYLTRSEYQCLKLTSGLKSIKEVANALNLGQRTVETHLNNVKRKFQCHKKSDFMKIIHQLLL